MEKVCEVCGKAFEKSLSNKKYCSVECAKKAKVVRNRKYKQAKRQEQKKICLTCGKAGSRQKYCSPECSRMAKNLQTKQYSPLQKNYVIGRAEFDARNYGAKTCSSECSFIFGQERTKVPLKNMGREKGIEVPDEALAVRVVSFTEDYMFKTLRQAVNFLSIFTKYDTAECIELLRQRESKIGEYKIFYD